MRKTVSLFLSLLLAFLPLFGTYGEEAAPSEEGVNRLTFYWNGNGTDLAKCDMWIWMPGAEGHGYLFEECPYGGKVSLEVPKGVDQVGFIVRTGCSDPGGSAWGNASKDYEADRFALVTGANCEIYLRSGEGDQYTSADGGQTLEAIREFTLAAIQSTREIRYTVSPSVRLTGTAQVRVYCDGEEVGVEKISSLNNKVITGVVTVDRDVDLTKKWEMEIEGYGRTVCVPTAVFDTAEFRESCLYDGNDLGATLHGEETTFKVWAPTADRVQLNLFEAGDGVPAYARMDMERGEKGVWTLTAPCGSGTYYTYSVTTALGTQEAVDPYARAAGVNGDRGMVVDLASTDPEGFREEGFEPAIRTYRDAVVWEVHVRDFSIADPMSAYPGKYLAFTETGHVNAAGEKIGVDYLKDLGVTHVHLQPVFDYATVDEAAQEKAQYNWGYDPKNYNVPEGSYSTDPFHGETRICEFKRMVQALHRAGIGVVMDVVYNHTWSLDSALNRIVPYYYYRWQQNGDPSNGSGCGNETASEREMFRKYMVDSVLYWLEEYRVDGFRFDLMALHDLETMQAIEQAVHEKAPKTLLYGEGWTGGTSALKANRQTSQTNLKYLSATQGAAGGIAVFNDVIRDGLKGSVFGRTDRGYISGAVNKTTAARVVFGLTGASSSGAAWKAQDAMVVNYMSSHDNHTLWDKLALSNPDASDAARASMVRLGAGAVMLSQGMVFFLAGEEMLRTKLGEENSYKSPDSVNHLDWESLETGSLAKETSEYYRQLIRMRKENTFLTDPDILADCEILSGQVIHVRYLRGDRLEGEAWLNPNPAPFSAEMGLENGRVLLKGEDFPREERVSRGQQVLIPAGCILVTKAE